MQSDNIAEQRKGMEKGVVGVDLDYKEKEARQDENSYRI